jgi:hypothetical protein
MKQGRAINTIFTLIVHCKTTLDSPNEPWIFE